MGTGQCNGCSVHGVDCRVQSEERKVNTAFSISGVYVFMHSFNICIRVHGFYVPSTRNPGTLRLHLRLETKLFMEPEPFIIKIGR